MKLRKRKPYTLGEIRVMTMTIAVGFSCADGIVICVDRQFTAAGSHKFSQEKVLEEEVGDYRLIFVFSGFPNLAEEVHRKIVALLEDWDRQIKDGIIRKHIYQAMDQVLTEMGRLTGVFDGQLQFLLGVFCPYDSMQLLMFDGQAISIVRDKAAILGRGDTSLIHFLADRLYSPALDIHQVASLGAYIVKKATEYVDGCGEPIDVVLINPIGIIREDSSPINQAILKMEDREKQVFTSLVPPERSSPI